MDLSALDSVQNVSSIVYSPLKCIEIEKQVSDKKNMDETPKSFKYGNNTMKGYNKQG